MCQSKMEQKSWPTMTRATFDSGLDLERPMAGLSPKTRQAIQCVKLDGLSVREAAEKCGMSESALKVSIHRGLRALAILISRERRAGTQIGSLTC
jgi:RNA polymerase sigma-70 factor, ECF subfamily